jgi:hypothetical protein
MLTKGTTSGRTITAPMATNKKAIPMRVNRNVIPYIEWRTYSAIARVNCALFFHVTNGDVVVEDAEQEFELD